MAYSLWKHNVRDGTEKLSFLEAMAQEKVRESSESFKKAYPYTFPNFFYRKRACFGEQIRRYYEAFDHRNINVVLLEDMQENQEKVFADVLTFLGLPLATIQFTKKNVTGSLHSQALQKILIEKDHSVRWLVRWLPKNIKDRLFDILYYGNRKQTNDVFAPLDENQRVSLMPLFQDDVSLLEKITGINSLQERWFG